MGTISNVLHQKQYYLKSLETKTQVILINNIFRKSQLICTNAADKFLYVIFIKKISTRFYWVVIIISIHTHLPLGLLRFSRKRIFIKFLESLFLKNCCIVETISLRM